MADETKSIVQKSEAWLSAIAAGGALMTAYLSHIEGAATWIAVGVCLLLAGTYAFFRTPLAAPGAPGIKTRTFWTSIMVVVTSIAGALAEVNIAGVPAKVTQAAGVVSAALVAFGYTLWRYKKKAVDEEGA